MRYFFIGYSRYSFKSLVLNGKNFVLFTVLGSLYRNYFSYYTVGFRDLSSMTVPFSWNFIFVPHFSKITNLCDFFGKVFHFAVSIWSPFIFKSKAGLQPSMHYSRVIRWLDSLNNILRMFFPKGGGWDEKEA